MPKEKSSSTTKKMLRKEISSQVENALPQLKALLGQEKFESRLKKAVKILTEDLPVSQPEAEKVALPKKEKPLPNKEKEVKVKIKKEKPEAVAEIKKPEAVAAKKAAAPKPKSKKK